MDKSYFLSAILPLVSAILSVTFYILWRREKQRAYVLNWALAYVCAVLGSGFDMARVLFADASVISLVANGFFVAISLLAVRGTLLRYRGRPLDGLLLPIYLLTMVCVLWFTSVSESILWRGWAASAGAAVMFLIAANAIAKAKPYEMLDRITRLTFLSTALVLLARPLVSIIYEGSLHLEAEVPHSFWLVSFKVFAMLSWFATAMLFLLQITTDLMKELAGQSRTDPLTGIFNRRGFQAEADRLLPSASTSIPACLLLFDIDRFKTVNDSYGHAVGDAVILGMAEILRQRGDATGCAVGRLGGEEFAALLPVTTLVSARALAEDMRNAFRHRSHRGVPSSHSVTVSVGIAEYQQGESLDSLIERADVALYQAKRGGRDRVVIASPAPANPVALMQAGQLALG